jgi:pimeloyl-ACP methyl ester carboxylesterase
LGRELPVIAADVSEIADYVKEQEAAYNIKADNESRIWWADSVGQRTEYVLLYLHGFSASYYEGFPVNYDLSARFGMNAYVPRLAAHGLVSEEPLLEMTPESLYRSAREALAIARVLGEKVIVMGTSSGGMLSLMLAADFPELVDALILYSPNIRIKDKAAPLLSGPWGLQIARLAFGGKYRETADDKDGKICRYWNCRYRLEAAVYLQQLVDAGMNEEAFAKVTQPVFLGYYYKDEAHQDQTVEVAAALRMFDELSTPDSLKVKRAFPEAGAHVIASELTSASVQEVESATFEFVEKILGVAPNNK